MRGGRVATSASAAFDRRAAGRRARRPRGPVRPAPVHRAVSHGDGQTRARTPAVFRRRVVAFAGLAHAVVRGLRVGGGAVHARRPCRPTAPTAVDLRVKHRTRRDSLVPVLVERVAIRSGRAGLVAVVPATVGIHGVEAALARGVAIAMVGGDFHEGVVGGHVDGFSGFEELDATDGGGRVGCYLPDFDHTSLLRPRDHGYLLDQTLSGGGVDNMDLGVQPSR